MRFHYAQRHLQAKGDIPNGSCKDVVYYNHKQVGDQHSLLQFSWIRYLRLSNTHFPMPPPHQLHQFPCLQSHILFQHTEEVSASALYYYFYFLTLSVTLLGRSTATAGPPGGRVKPAALCTAPLLRLQPAPLSP